MDQSPFLNQEQVTNNNVPGKAAFGNIKNLLIYVFLMVIAIALGVGGFFFGLNFGSKATIENVKSLNSSVPIRFTKAQEIIEEGAGLVKDVSVRVIYSGKLVSFEAGKSWTLQRKGENVTLSRTGSEIIRYYLSHGQNLPLVQINESDLKIGDDISIIAYINPETGYFLVDLIEISLNASSEATQGAVNNP